MAHCRARSNPVPPQNGGSIPSVTAKHYTVAKISVVERLSLKQLKVDHHGVVVLKGHLHRDGAHHIELHRSNDQWSQRGHVATNIGI
ncbi:hypothetical protein NL676_013695 [Syzygium grande]|nr:hypothetical protein NL676_013695 [Syzygium grande]